MLNGQDYMELNIIVFMQDGKRIKTQNICLEDIGDVIMTRADEIRSMTDEELAEVLFGSCIERMGVEECSYPVGSLKDIPDCKSCILDWLRAESESI